jgi:hypothetical protein
MKVHYLFSKNNKIGSKLISWGTKQLYNTEKTPSHIALLINERWVFESTLFTGVRIITYDRWKDINEEVAKYQCPKDNTEFSTIKNLYREIDQKGYDWLGTCFLGVYLALNKFFGITIPQKNYWENENKYFCCEVIAKLTGVNDYAMKAPVNLMVELEGRFNG